MDEVPQTFISLYYMQRNNVDLGIKVSFTVLIRLKFIFYINTICDFKYLCFVKEKLCVTLI